DDQYAPIAPERSREDDLAVIGCHGLRARAGGDHQALAEFAEFFIRAEMRGNGPRDRKRELALGGGKGADLALLRLGQRGGARRRLGLGLVLAELGQEVAGTVS